MRMQDGLLVWSFLIGLLGAAASASEFDHSYALYSEALRFVRLPHVDYTALKQHRGALDRAVAEFATPAAAQEPRWTREQRIAFWINAYNAFTLRVIVDHYPTCGCPSRASSSGGWPS